MSRIRIDGTPIGCPAIHGEGNCPMCGGGWPGTTAPSELLVRAARTGRLQPELLGCGPLVAQAQHLIRVIGTSDGKEVTDMIPTSEKEHLTVENDYGIGPVGGGIYGPAWMGLVLPVGRQGNKEVKQTPLTPTNEVEQIALLELPVGPVVLPG